jgi:hypothetical protein
MRMFISVVCAIAVLVVIKMINLPGFITALLVLIVMGFVIYSLSGAFIKKETDARK